MSKNLQYYLDNPLELPEDESEILALLEAKGDPDDEGESGDREAVKSDKQDEDGDTSGQADDKNKAEDEVDDNAPVLTKDGKHVIPHSVLKREREASRAKDNRIAELTRELEQARSAAGGEHQTELSDEVLEEIESIKEDYPALAKVLEAQAAEIKRLQSGRQADAKPDDNANEEDGEADDGGVQDLIDDNPKLAALQAEGGKAWERIVAMDNYLRDNDTDGFESLEARFAEALKMYEARYGEIELKRVDERKGEPKEDKRKESKREAAKRIADETSGEATINSLSDLSGSAGSHAETDKFASMSAKAIEQELMTMSPDKFKAAMSSFGIDMY